ncbi:HBL/NHE enterotoxin family protein [Streptomyces sp. NPDC048362]|uniref:HBL/NHE enterotoxin family protein n=1 Tax=Streptomyces sp. NPDC048362 TaxID=3365539 RepID=UPI003720B928
MATTPTDLSESPLPDVIEDTEEHGTCVRLIQGYATSLERQMPVNFEFGGIPGLKEMSGVVGGNLVVAKAHATEFLNVYQPKAVDVVVSIRDLADMYDSITSELTPKSTKAEVVNALSEFKELVEGYTEQAAGVASAMQTARQNFNADSANMTQGVSDLEAKLAGTSGILAEIDKQVDELNSQINGMIGGMVASVLGAIAGAIMIAVGAVGSVLTGGTSVPLIVAGVAVCAGGVGGSIAGGIKLAEAIELRDQKILQRAEIHQQLPAVKLLKDNLALFSTQASNSAAASQAMANSWNILKTDLITTRDRINKNGFSEAELKRWVAKPVARLAQSSEKCLEQLGNPVPVDSKKSQAQVQRELTATAGKMPVK